MKKYLLTLFVPMMVFASEQNTFEEVKSLSQQKKWNQVIDVATTMEKNYSESLFLKEVYFFLGKAYFHDGDSDLANRYFTKFLESDGASIYFEEAISYKYFIAEKFENGHYGHLFGVKVLPRLEPMWEVAYQLYDEVMYTLPRHEVAAKAMFNKARMLAYDTSFDEANDTLTNLIRRFPKNILAQKAYVQIVKNYNAKVCYEYLDPRAYEFAMINQKKFANSYPSSTLRKEMDEQVLAITDLFAEDVYKSAMYFDKKDNKESALMYYRSLLQKYPKSKFALRAANKIAEYEEKQKLLNSNESAILVVGVE